MIERKHSIVDNLFMKSLFLVTMGVGTGLIADGIAHMAFPSQPDNCVSYVRDGEGITADELQRRIEADECTMKLSDLNNRTNVKEISYGTGLIIGDLGLGATILLSRRSRSKKT